MAIHTLRQTVKRVDFQSGTASANGTPKAKVGSVVVGNHLSPWMNEGPTETRISHWVYNNVPCVQVLLVQSLSTLQGLLYYIAEKNVW